MYMSTYAVSQARPVTMVRTTGIYEIVFDIEKRKIFCER